MDALEIRPDHEGKFDELVARFADGMVVAEDLGSNGCHVGFYWDDGRYCDWWIGGKKKLRYNHEDGIGDPPRFTAHGVDRDAASDDPQGLGRQHCPGAANWQPTQPKGD